MAKISFNKLGLKKEMGFNIVTINGVDIEVKKYLPNEEKENLIQMVMQSSFENGFVNPFKMDIFFHLYFVMKYSNISFTENMLKNEIALFDTLDSNGVIDSIIDANYTEYQNLLEYCLQYKEAFEKFENSFYGMATRIIGSVPESMNEALEALEKLDLSKVSETLQLVNVNAGNKEALEVYLGGQIK